MKPLKQKAFAQKKQKNGNFFKRPIVYFEKIRYSRQTDYI